MNKLIPLLAFSVLLLVPVSQNAFAGPPLLVLEISPTVDGDSDGASLFTGDLTLETGRSGGIIWRSFTEFDISGIDDVTSATLQFNVEQANPTTVDVFSYAGNGAPNIGVYNAGTLFSTSTFAQNIGIQTIDVTTEVANHQQLGTNFIGFNLRLTSEVGTNLHVFSSSETPNFVNSPKLIIVFEEGTPVVGGEIIPIETTSLLLASSQSFSWMIPVLLSGIGIGLVLVRRKKIE